MKFYRVTINLQVLYLFKVTFREHRLFLVYLIPTQRYSSCTANFILPGECVCKYYYECFCIVSQSIIRIGSVNFAIVGCVCCRYTLLKVRDFNALPYSNVVRFVLKFSLLSSMIRSSNETNFYSLFNFMFCFYLNCLQYYGRIGQGHKKRWRCHSQSGFKLRSN